MNASNNQHGAQVSALTTSVIGTPSLKKRGRPARSASPRLLSAPNPSKKPRKGASPTHVLHHKDTTLIPAARQRTRKVVFKSKLTSVVDPITHDTCESMEDASDHSTGVNSENLIELHPRVSDESVSNYDCSQDSDESTTSQNRYKQNDPKYRDTPTIRNYDKISKNIPKFKGGPDDHFEAWMTNVDLYLRNQCSTLTENQKLTAVLLKIEGYPRLILKGIKKNLKSVKDIFKALKQTYGQDELTMLANIRQLPEEPVRVYYSRLKTNLGLLGHNDTTKGQRIYLNYFLTGLLPKLRSQVENLMPQRLEDALALANSFENKNLTVEIKKGKKSNDDSIEKMNVMHASSDLEKTIQKSLLTMNNNLEKKLADKFNLLSGRMGQLLKNNQDHHEPKYYPNTQNNARQYDNDYRRNDRDNRNYYTPHQSRDRTHHDNRNSYHNTNYKSSNQYSNRQNHNNEFKCYGCEELGHRYRYCPKLSQDQ